MGLWRCPLKGQEALDSVAWRWNGQMSIYTFTIKIKFKTYRVIMAHVMMIGKFIYQNCSGLGYTIRTDRAGGQ